MGQVRRSPNSILIHDNNKTLLSIWKVTAKWHKTVILKPTRMIFTHRFSSIHGIHPLLPVIFRQSLEGVNNTWSERRGLLVRLNDVYSNIVKDSARRIYQVAKRKRNCTNLSILVRSKQNRFSIDSDIRLTHDSRTITSGVLCNNKDR